MEKPEVGCQMSEDREQRSPVKFASLHIFNIFNGAGKGREQRSEIGRMKDKRL
jgi:hypothetical protein